MRVLPNEIFQEIKSVWINLECLEKEVIRSFGHDDPISENIGYACVYLMNANIEIEENPNIEINLNMLEDITLDQIFDVLNLIRGEAPESQPSIAEAARRAFLTSSKFYGVHRNTIADACTRRLQLKLAGFLELVQKWLNGDSSGPKAVLKSHTPEHYQSEIDRFFG
jgi:hypothetical protein